jgi:ABC-type uncharacterized transport system involved in gliding motility auxiliary subunit
MNVKLVGRVAGMFGLVVLFSAVFNWLFVTGSIAAPAVLIRVALAAAGIGFWLVATRDEKRLGRGAFFGTVSFVSTLVLVAALVAVNYIAVKKPHSWDVTKEKIFTLSDQTVSTLHELKVPVTITAFFGPADGEYNDLVARLDQYKRQTDKLTVEYVDPIKHPQVVQEKNLSQTGPRVFFKSGPKEVRAKDTSEEALTNCIIEATKPATKKVYFSRGHGEASIGDGQERGFKNFADQLKNEGYLVDEILLAEHKTMPDDMLMLVIAGPEANFQPGELKLVNDWVANQTGRLIVMLNPSADGALTPSLESWGIHTAKDIVVDPDSQSPELAIAQQYTGHPITNSNKSVQMAMTVFPLARTMARAATPPTYWNVTEVARTGRRAWGEMDAESIKTGKVEFDAGTDIAGPVALVTAVTRGDPKLATETRIVAFGNSTFASNSFLSILGNRDLASNTVAWVAKEESRISIRPRQRLSNHLYLTAEQKGRMTLFAFDLLPFGLLFAGLVVWQTRKSR